MSDPSAGQVEPHDISELVEPRHHRAEIVFGVLSFAFALFLLSQIPSETTWANGKRFVEQPGFWPIVSIAGMTVFGAFELLYTWRRLGRCGDGDVTAEVFDWARALEFVVWFMAYVFAVPLTGYLPTTVVFCAALTWRLGYRSAGVIGIAILVGIGTVIVFKSLLSVRIPGGAIYELLPEAARNFMILYL